jgi:hypothetical protein
MEIELNQRQILASFELAKQLCRQLPKDTTAITAEFAFLFAYCLVAHGVRAYPDDTKFLRTLVLLSRISTEFAKQIEAIGLLSDAEIEALATANARKPS